MCLCVFFREEGFQICVSQKKKTQHQYIENDFVKSKSPQTNEIKS